MAAHHAIREITTMGESESRRQRRQKAREEAARPKPGPPPAKKAPPPAAPPATLEDILDAEIVDEDEDVQNLPEVHGRDWMRREINFQVPPGDLLRPVGAPPLVRRAKTVRVPGELGLHVGGFQARHGTHLFNFERTSLALWRVLLREEHAANELARWATAQTGVPAQPKMGVLYRKLMNELETMREESDEG
ncbi:hypothetical protein ACH4S8_37245 [Streptomyces sp. NPDC021080]|uniref:hypothetical protein n=1 Tax=Streptomyces sp. NPDC021080 TaxID=3365110 RepID=UPI0037B77B2B